jgi:hypothetical protein
VGILGWKDWESALINPVRVPAYTRVALRICTSSISTPVRKPVSKLCVQAVSGLKSSQRIGLEGADNWSLDFGGLQCSHNQMLRLV